MDLIVSEEIIAVGDKLSWESVRVREKIGYDELLVERCGVGWAGS